jgi:hypothetical protein
MVIFFSNLISENNFLASMSEKLLFPAAMGFSVIIYTPHHPFYDFILSTILPGRKEKINDIDHSYLDHP